MIVVDTGPLLAAADADDHLHGLAVEFFDTHDTTELVVPATVVWAAPDGVGGASPNGDHRPRSAA